MYEKIIIKPERGGKSACMVIKGERDMPEIADTLISIGAGIIYDLLKDSMTMEEIINAAKEAIAQVVEMVGEDEKKNNH